MTIEQLVSLEGIDFNNAEVKNAFISVYQCEKNFEEKWLEWLFSIWKELAMRFEMPSSTQAEKDVIRDVFVFAVRYNRVPKNLCSLVEECCATRSFKKLEEELSNIPFFNLDKMKRFYEKVAE